jgi:hypothetical protein
MNEIIFLVEDSPEGSFSARVPGCSMFTGGHRAGTSGDGQGRGCLSF